MSRSPAFRPCCAPPTSWCPFLRTTSMVPSSYTRWPAAAPSSPPPWAARPMRWWRVRRVFSYREKTRAGSAVCSELCSATRSGSTGSGWQRRSARSCATPGAASRKRPNARIGRQWAFRDRALGEAMSRSQVISRRCPMSTALADYIPVAPASDPESAADLLVERHLSLARRVATRYVGRGEPLDDLVQVAMLGLVKAAQRYDPTRGTE